MANELRYAGFPDSQAGLAGVVTRVYDAAGAQVGADVAMTESGVAPALYIGDMPTATLGVYVTRAFDSAGTLLGQGVITWDGTGEALLNLDVAVSSRSDFDESTDTVARVTLVDTTTANADMRGTDSALLASGYTAPDNASVAAILVDTSELQTNQGDWATATGFAVPGDVTAAQVAIIAEVDANEVKIDALPTTAPLDATATQAAAAAAITAAEPIEANVTQVGGVAVAGVAAFHADTSALATQTSVDGLNDIAAADVLTQANAALAAYDAPTKAELDAAESAILGALPAAAPSAADIYAEFTSGANEDAFKADVSAIETQAQADARQVTLIAEHDATQAAIDGLPAGITAADVWAVPTRTVTGGVIDTSLDMRGTDSALLAAGYTAPDNASITLILADTSDLQGNQGDWVTATGFATPASVTAAQAAVIAEVDANETKIDGLVSDITALETKAQADARQVTIIAEHDATQASLAALPVPLTAAQVNAEVDTALADYDGPTKAEIDTAEANIIAASPGAAPTAADNAAAVRVELATELARVDVATSTRAAAGDAMTLTAGERSTLAATIEAALLNEGDGQQLIDAIVMSIGNTNVDETLLVAAIRADLERAGGLLDILPTLTEVEASTILAKTADVAGLNDIDAAAVLAQVTAALATYDGPTKAELDATEASILGALPAAGPSAADIYLEFTSGTNEDVFKADTSGLATAASLSSVAGSVAAVLTDTGTTLPAQISALPAAPSAASVAAAVRVDQATELARIDVAVSSVAAGSIPTAADVAAEVESVLSASHGAGTWTGADLSGVLAAIAALPADVRTELATELARIDAAVSSRESEADAAARAGAAATAATLTDIEADLVIINEGVQAASLLIPHSTDLP